MLMLKTLKSVFISDSDLYIINRDGQFVNIYEHITKDNKKCVSVYTIPFSIIISFSKDGKEILL